MEYAAAVMIVAVAAMVRGATGFGFALIAAPALTFIWEPVTATSLVLVLDLVATAMIVRSGALKDIRRNDALVIGVAGIVGVIAGVLFIKNIPEDVARIGLDITVLISAVAAILNIRVRRLDHWSVALVVGLLVGAMIGAFAIGGALLLAWLMAVGRTPGEIRALLTIVFGLTDGFAVILRVAFGVFPMEAATGALLLAPVMILGIMMGTVVFRRASADLWRRGVAILLIAIASFSLAHTFLSA